MTDVSDLELVRDYTAHNSESAFAELVRRHISLVYSVALRYTGNSQDAEDVTQAVFIILARKAAGLRDRTVLTGWLYETARFAGMQFSRTNIRRRIREQEAHVQSIVNDPETDDAWRQIVPLLEVAMTRLGEKDRTLLALRFFENRNVTETAALLGIGEWAARKRTERAVDKLRIFFARRGITIGASVLTGAISAHSLQAAPAALANSVVAVAMAKGAAAGGSTLTLIKGALKIMAWTKAKTAIVVGAGVLLAAGTTTIVVTKVRSASLDVYLRDPELNDISNAPPMVVIQPTHFPKGFVQGSILGRTDGTREIGRNISLSIAILKAYGFPSSRRMICPEELQRIRVDYLVTVPDRPQERFQAEIKRKFGWTAHVQTRETDVFLLRVKRPNAPGLTPADNSSWQDWFAKHPQQIGIHRHNITLSNFAELIEGFVQKPVVDQTGLTGNYDFETGSFGLQEINQVFINQLGLELVPSREPVEMLVVEKTK